MSRSTRRGAKVSLLLVLVGCLFIAAASAFAIQVPDLPAAAGRPSATSPPVAGQYPLVGVQFQGTWSNYTDAQRKKLLDDLVNMGVHTVRIGVSWAMLQPQQPTSTDSGWSWGWGIRRVDSVVSMALARGLVVHATFGRTPAWANGGAGEAAAPTHLSDWRRAVRFVATRYRGKISSWEIWNEPNLPTYFAGGTPASYTKLLCAAYPIIHAVSKDTPVVFGGVAGNDWRFIERSYQAGVKGCFDVLAVHPYQRWGLSPGASTPNADPSYFGNVSLVRQVQRRFHDLKPIWFTEFGWSTHVNSPKLLDYQRGVSEQVQARYLVRTLELTQQRYPYVARAYIYEARDENAFDVDNDNYGLFTLSLAPKPAVAALREYLRAR